MGGADSIGFLASFTGGRVRSPHDRTAAGRRQRPARAGPGGRRQEPREELDQGAPGDIGDADLPDDLQPTEDNPLARHPGQSGDEDDEIGTDREGETETAPLTEDDSDYGSAGGS